MNSNTSRILVNIIKKSASVQEHYITSSPPNTNIGKKKSFPSFLGIYERLSKDFNDCKPYNDKKYLSIYKIELI